MKKKHKQMPSVFNSYCTQSQLTKAVDVVTKKKPEAWWKKATDIEIDSDIQSNHKLRDYFTNKQVCKWMHVCFALNTKKKKRL